MQNIKSKVVYTVKAEKLAMGTVENESLYEVRIIIEEENPNVERIREVLRQAVEFGMFKQEVELNDAEETCFNELIEMDF